MSVHKNEYIDYLDEMDSEVTFILTEEMISSNETQDVELFSFETEEDLKE